MSRKPKHSDAANSPKPLFWMGGSKKNLQQFPEEVQDLMGFALWQAQTGKKHLDAKPLKGFGGAGVLEIVEDFDGNTYRGIYAVKFSGVIYVLHTFQKKIEKGRKNSLPRNRTYPRPSEIGGRTQ